MPRMSRYEVIREFVNQGYQVPIDVATSLIGEGYDISEFENNLDGFSIEDVIDHMEKYEY